MVSDMQVMLLTGGVKTNVFKSRKDFEIVVVTNDNWSFEEACSFFESQVEVLKVFRAGN